MKLVTVAVYNQPVQAQIARNALDAEGIWAVVADAEVALMDVLLTSAIGGVKVQVKEEDAERATEFLAEIYGTEDSTAPKVDEAELERQALEAMPDESEEPPPPASEQTVAPLTLERGYKDTREQYARRFFFTMIFAIIISAFVSLGCMAPFFFYAFYLTLNVLFGHGSLSKRGWLFFALGLMFFLPLLWSLILLVNISRISFFS